MRFTTLMALLALAVCVLSRAEEIEKQSEEIVATAKRRADAIAREIKNTKQPEWAGIYSFGDGRGVNVRLSLAARAGFAFEWDGCLGVYDGNYGQVEFADGVIRMKCELPNRADAGFQGMATEFLPVHWGKRRYLIATAELTEFCNAVNAGDEPREAGPLGGSFLLREGDERKPAHGQPLLPKEYVGFLLRRPVSAEVVDVKSVRGLSPRGEPSENWKATDVVLNAGRSQGVFTGMKFHVVKPDNVESAKVVSVAEDSAEAVIHQYKTDSSDPQPTIGWQVSTRPTYR
jgi:hypothetical protein